VYNTIVAKLQSEEKIIICIASSGIVALLVDGRQTFHSTFIFPIEINEDLRCAIDKTLDRVDLLHKILLIIWNEVPMQHCHCPKAIDLTLYDLCDNDKAFRGMIVVFGSDFCQNCTSYCERFKSTNSSCFT